MNCGRHLGSLLLAAPLLLPLATIGCAERHYYRVYDPYYGDYHDWDDHERVTSTRLGKHVKETWREFQGDWLSPRESVGIHLL